MSSNFLSSLFLITPLLVAITSSTSWGQATSGVGDAHRRSLPGPVRHVDAQNFSAHGATGLRQAQHLAPIIGDEVPSAFSPDDYVEGDVHAHRVIRSPDWQSTKKGRHGPKRKSNHPPHFSRHRGVQPPAAVLPQARQKETWKSPYSYGYFGASGTRHWSLHYGYRDRYTEWRLR